MRVRREDAAEGAGRDRRDVLLRERRPQALLAGSADVVPRGLLGVAEDAEVHAALVEDARKGLRHLLVSGVEGGVVAHEPEMLGRLLADVLDVEVELPRPAGALSLRFPEGVPGGVDRLERPLEL